MLVGVEILDYLKFLTEQIHTVIIATLQSSGNPITCAIDIMDYDEKGLYFLTARGKSFYERLKLNPVVSLTGLCGHLTLESQSITIHGQVKEIGTSRLSRLFEKNPYINDIYPTKESRQNLTVFQLYEGEGEFFDLSVQPILRKHFSFGKEDFKSEGLYFIQNHCIHCGKCMSVCPQKCIIDKNNQMMILQEHCLHCGNCLNICPVHAV